MRSLFRFSLVALVIAVLICFLAPVLARADEYQRVVFTSGTGGAVTNTAAFYNAKLLSVRAKTITPVVTHTNTITLTTVSDDGVLTNTCAVFTTTSSTTSGAADLSSSNLYLLRGDVLVRSSSSNTLVEVVLDNRSR